MLLGVGVLSLALVVLAPVTTGEDVTCSGECVRKWKKCAGSGIPTVRACCDDGFICLRKNQSYAQCRRADRPPPSSWKDPEVLTCSDATCDDPAAITVSWMRVSANSFTNFENGRNVGSFDEIEECAAACEANDNCFAFEEYERDGFGERCELWGKDLISVEPLIDAVDIEPNLEPSMFSVISFTKCFNPQPLCDPATREVRRVNSHGATFFEFDVVGAGSFDRNRDVSFYTSGTAEQTFDACIDVCRLSQSPPAFNDVLHCTGFAIDEAEIDGTTRTLCTLLYNESPVHKEYVPTAGSRVFTLDGCPTSTELAQRDVRG